MPTLCPHNQNPQACLTCFHTKGAKRAVPRVPAGQMPAANPHARSAPPGATSNEVLWEPPVHPRVCDRVIRRG